MYTNEVHNNIWIKYLLFSYVATKILITFLGEKFFGIDGFGLTPYIRAIFIGMLAIGVYFYFLPIISLGRKIQLYKLDLTMIVPVLLLVAYSVPIGVYESNPVSYVLSDAIYLIIGLVIFILTRLNNFILRIDNKKLYKTSLIVGSIIILINYMGISFIPFVFFFFGAILVYSIYVWDKRTFFVSIIPFVFVTSNMNRTALLSIIVVYIMLLFPLFYKKKYTKFLVFSIPLIALCVLTYLLINYINFISGLDFMNTPLGGRIIRTISIFNGEVVDFSKDIAIQQRIYEIQVSLSTFNNNTLSLILGQGSGATIDMSNSLDRSVTGNALLGEENVHNIHFLPVAVLYRYGIVGILIFILLFFYLFRQIFITEDSKILIPTFAALLIMIYSFSASSVMIADPLIWVAMGAIFNVKILDYRKIKKNIDL